MRRPSWVAISLPCVALPLLACCAAPPPGREPRPRAVRDTHGIAVGDVTATSAVIWVRAERPAWLNVSATSAASSAHGVARCPRDRDSTCKLLLDGLAPGSRFVLRAWLTDSPDVPLPPRGALVATFRTAPPAESAAAVRFGWGGDVGGQGVCRQLTAGYPVFRTLARTPMSFFVGLGDMIYADETCDAAGGYGSPQVAGGFPRSTRIEDFRAHWAYNRADAGFRSLLQKTPYVAVWDDHEITNDAGPRHDRSRANPTVPLMPLGLRAFQEWNPITEHPATPQRLYRSLRWGRHLELLLLDTRQYRDPNYSADVPQRPKTMLGLEQLAWVEQHLRSSDATWLVVVSSVPMSVPTGQDSFGRDGWANEEGPTGFEQELLRILRTAREAGRKNLLWITTDVHFATGFRYRPFPEDPSFVVYEVATGPMNAGLFPTARLDHTLRPERLFFFAPADPRTVRDRDTALSWMSYGLVHVDAAGALTVSAHRAVTGQPVFRQTLLPR